MAESKECVPGDKRGAGFAEAVKEFEEVWNQWYQQGQKPLHFFGLSRHESFQAISKNAEIQDALRDLYDHPDKVELYLGIFCESLADKGADSGPLGLDSALWAAIFSDAITPLFVQTASILLIEVKGARNDSEANGRGPEDVMMTRGYFAQQMKSIVEREAVTVKSEGKLIFQVDITRTYNADETKLLKRRNAFKGSMVFLLKLAGEGNILEASRWRVSTAIRGLFKRKARPACDITSGSMRALGLLVAKGFLKNEKDSGKATAILLLTALDVAYSSVLSFAAILDHLLHGAYEAAEKGKSRRSEWFEIQRLAFINNKESDTEIHTKVLEAQRQSVKLPYIRKVIKDEVEITENGKAKTVKKGQTIVCDTYAAMLAFNKDQLTDYYHLNYISSLSAGLVHFNPKDIALHGLTAMIKVVAQMKNLRRGHTSQGQLKKIPIDQTSEEYANFMAPGRMNMIASDVKMAEKRLELFDKAKKHTSFENEEEKKGYEMARKAERDLLRRQFEDATKVFSKDILKPQAETYLSAERDEMVPFPTTWKVRFDGYGPSNYGDDTVVKNSHSPCSAQTRSQIAIPHGTNHKVLVITVGHLAIHPQKETENLEGSPSLNNLNDDVLFEICASVKQLDASQHPTSSSHQQLLSPLKALSATNKHMRNLAARAIFQGIKIGPEWDWERALRALDSIAQCEAVTLYANCFMIDLYIGPTYEEMQRGYDKKGPPPPKRFPQTLLEVLTSLGNIKRLILAIPEHHTEVFRKTFNKSKPSFPSVRNLVLGPHMDWIIAMCPNVTTVSSYDWRWLRFNVDGKYSNRHSADLIKSAGQAKMLRHFEMQERWSWELLEAVYEAMPMIQSLAMPVGGSRDGIDILLPTLSRFRHLTSLVLPDASSLNVGFDPPWCGNAYMGPGGQELARRVETERKQAEEMIARMVSGQMPKLEELWVGDHSKADITRTNTGGVGAISWSYGHREQAS
ncbi:MAG: hypothetical protein Q9213_003126 [Squamulea squamosa]